MTGNAGCWARAENGHAVAPAISVMNSRLLNRSDRIRFPAPSARLQNIELPGDSQWVGSWSRVPSTTGFAQIGQPRQIRIFGALSRRHGPPDLGDAIFSIIKYLFSVLLRVIGPH